MAGLSTKAIKNRIKSMNSTRQITKAMELVATSKLKSAQQRALKVRPYFDSMLYAMNCIASSSKSFESAFLKDTKKENPIYVVIAGDRGLAGGYNSNVFRACAGIPKGSRIIPIGKRAVEYFKKRDYIVETESYAEAAIIYQNECFSIARYIADQFLEGKCDSAHVIYTRCTSLLSQTPDSIDLLPIHMEKKEDKEVQKVTSSLLYEPDPEELFNQIVPEYLGAMLYGSLCESVASEQAARRNAMNSASKNADEIIANLDLVYNRARQAAITQEITEIVAGSNAQ